MKQCTKCGKWFLPDEINSKGHCKICVRDYDWLRRRHITPEEYANLFNIQGGKCAICEKSYKDERQMLAVDHCHNTNKIRGLLCRKCNLAIGLLNENPNLFIKAISYLQGEKMEKVFDVITQAFKMQFDALTKLQKQANAIELKLLDVEKELEYIRKTY